MADLQTRNFLCGVVVVGMLTSCAGGSSPGGSQQGNCDTIGQMIGVVIGGTAGIFGTRAAGSNTVVQILATVGGAAAGAWLGGQFACYLTRDDQEKMATASQKTAVTGQTTTWSNPNTGASGTAEVIRTEDVEKQASIPVLKGRVSKVPPLDLIGQPYQATTQANVRGGPGSDFVVVDLLRKGETVTVAGKVKGQPWYMINQNGVGAGFVHDSQLAAAPVPAAVKPPPPQAAPPAETV